MSFNVVISNGALLPTVKTANHQAPEKHLMFLWSLVIGCLTVGSKAPLLITTLNDMGAFFVLFYLSIDIEHRKCTLGKLRSHTITISCSKRVIYHSKVSIVTAPNVSLKCNGCGDWFVTIKPNRQVLIRPMAESN